MRNAHGACRELLKTTNKALIMDLDFSYKYGSMEGHNLDDYFAPEHDPDYFDEYLMEDE